MRQLLQGLKKDHIIIVDAPPLLPVTDAAVLTANADDALIVITAGVTLDTQLDAAIAHLEHVRGHILGVVFNKAQTSRRGSDEKDKSSSKPRKAPAVRSDSSEVAPLESGRPKT